MTQNTWSTITWNNTSLESLRLYWWQDSFYQACRFILTDNQQDADAFVRALSTWNENLEAGLQIDSDTQKCVTEETAAFSYTYIKELSVSSIMVWMKEAKEGAMAHIILAQTQTLKKQISVVTNYEESEEEC